MSYMTEMVWCSSCKTKKKRNEFFESKWRTTKYKEHLICNGCRKKGYVSHGKHSVSINWDNAGKETDGSEYIKMLEKSVGDEKYTGGCIDYGSVHKVHM